MRSLRQHPLKDQHLHVQPRLQQKLVHVAPSGLLLFQVEGYHSHYPLLILLVCLFQLPCVSRHPVLKNQPRLKRAVLHYFVNGFYEGDIEMLWLDHWMVDYPRRIPWVDDSILSVGLQQLDLR